MSATTYAGAGHDAALPARTEEEEHTMTDEFHEVTHLERARRLLKKSWYGTPARAPGSLHEVVDAILAHLEQQDDFSTRTYLRGHSDGYAQRVKEQQPTTTEEGMKKRMNEHHKLALTCPCGSTFTMETDNFLTLDHRMRDWQQAHAAHREQQATEAAPDYADWENFSVLEKRVYELESMNPPEAAYKAPGTTNPALMPTEAAPERATDEGWVTPEMAYASLDRFIVSHFRGKAETPYMGARFHIPVDMNRDDDMILSRFIKQVEDASAPPAVQGEERALLEKVTAENYWFKQAMQAREEREFYKHQLAASSPTAPTPERCEHPPIHLTRAPSGKRFCGRCGETMTTTAPAPRQCICDGGKVMPYLLHPMVVEGAASVLFADGGSGKSLVALACMVSVATGIEIIPGQCICDGGKVIRKASEHDRLCPWYQPPFAPAQTAERMDHSTYGLFEGAPPASVIATAATAWAVPTDPLPVQTELGACEVCGKYQDESHNHAEYYCRQCGAVAMSASQPCTGGRERHEWYLKDAQTEPGERMERGETNG